MSDDQNLARLCRSCAWIQIFRAFRIAIDIRKIALAGFAIVTLSAGNALFSRLPFAPAGGPRAWDVTFQQMQSDFGPKQPLATAADMAKTPWNHFAEVLANGARILSPVRALLDPAIVLFRIDHTWPEIAYAWTRLLWALFVWAIFGGAITRIAAVQFARDETVGLIDALNFSGQHFLSYVAAPLLPIVGVGVFWLACLLGGLFGRIPGIGNLVVGILWVIPLLCALFMALALVGVAVGWPLMFAAISTEGSDGFDGLSRSYSYVYNRPWYYAFLILVAVVYGTIVSFFVWLMAALLVYLSGWSVASGLGLESTLALFQATPGILGGTDLLAQQDVAVVPAGAVAVGVWLRVVALATVGFVYSFFWTAVTVIYFLLRKSDDETELDEVFVPRTEDPDELSADAVEEQPVQADDAEQSAPDQPTDGTANPPTENASATDTDSSG